MIKIKAFLFAVLLFVSNIFGAVPCGYEVGELLSDTAFRSGFEVLSPSGEHEGDFTFSDSSVPEWKIAQWNSKSSLWKNRADSDGFTISDGIKTVSVNPEKNSVYMSIDASKEYGGEPAGLDNWPHLLLEQSPFKKDSEKAELYSCINRIIFSADIRLAEYVPTTNPDGVNAAQFLTYFYMTGTDNRSFIWFGLNLFDDRGLMETSWSRDFADGAHNMIYTVSTKDTYGTKLRTLNKKGVSDKFTHISVDLTPYINDCVEKANSDNTFGKKVSADDFYFSGMNIGFEMHGNIKCAVEAANLSLKSYIRKG